MKYVSKVSFLLFVSWIGCSSDGLDNSQVCGLLPAGTMCGQSCTGDVSCGSGLYCKSSVCSADCIPGILSCGSDAPYCLTNGHCSTSPTGNTDGGFSDGDVCAEVNVGASGEIPTVALLIDQSGSMSQPLGDQTRWNAMKAALIDGNDSVVESLQDRVRYGLALYTGTNNTCPRLQQVAPAMHNYQAIKDLLNSKGPDSNTPTGDAINSLVPQLKALPADPTIKGPTIILLATDGLPDTCTDPNPPTDMRQKAAEQFTVNAATNAYGQGISTYILSVGPDVSDAHLQAMANAGRGVSSGGNDMPFYRANTAAELKTAIEGIIGQARSCRLTLTNSIDTSVAAQGNVRLAGNQLTYNGADGWTLLNSSTIELTGAACQTYLSTDAALTATFPCGSIIIM